uniref:RB1-inducible coiled-coil protein 1 n=1 Tax=Culex pipiens TaxID=7175 RepID=A0A8D8A8S9_CULPI
MLYVFHVDTGRMLTFEMSKALEIVRSLKETIERHHGIPCASIVLLVSGGEVLQDTQRVCNYSAGTDTNPIYMFSKSVLDARNQPAPWPSIETGEWAGFFGTLQKASFGGSIGRKPNCRTQNGRKYRSAEN